MILDFLRRPKASSAEILTPARLVEILGSGSGSAAGISVSPESAMRYATVFSCVRVLAESAALPLGIFRKDGAIQRPALDHPLARMFVQPNEWQTGQEFWEMCIAHLALRGNFYAWKNVVRGDVRELVPFAAGAVTPRRLLDRAGPVVYEVQFLDGSVRTLDQAEVFHVKLFSHSDGLAGLSPVGYAREPIGLGIATERHGSKLFSNGARPGGVLSTDKTLTEGAAKRLKERFETTHLGVENSNRLAVLEEGLKYQQVGLSSEDAQFLETRKFQRSEICGMFRVPPHMIADLERSTNNNIEHQGREFLQFTLVPYLRKIEARINATLVKPSERGIVVAEFDGDDYARGDMQARSLYYKSGILDGWLTRNEVRALESKPPLDGLDTPLIPLNMGDGTKPPAADPTKTPTEVKP